jgi:hypothetical protein
MSNRDDYIEKLKAQLDRLGADLDELETKFRKAETDVKMEKFEQINELRQRTAAARRTLVKIQEAGDDAWEDLKQSAESAWSALRDSFSKAKSEFKRGYQKGLED